MCHAMFCKHSSSTGIPARAVIFGIAKKIRTVIRGHSYISNVCILYDTSNDIPLSIRRLLHRGSIRQSVFSFQYTGHLGLPVMIYCCFTSIILTG